MFNDSDHVTPNPLTIEQIRAVLEQIDSCLEDAREHLDSGGNGWYSLDRLACIAETADRTLKGEVR